MVRMVLYVVKITDSDTGELKDNFLLSDLQLWSVPSTGSSSNPSNNI